MHDNVVVINTTPLIALSAAGYIDALNLTGSIGILIKAKRQGFPLDMRAAIQGMRERGIWLSAAVAEAALAAADEI